jgi:hypothetical protein
MSESKPKANAELLAKRTQIIESMNNCPGFERANYFEWEKELKDLEENYQWLPYETKKDAKVGLSSVFGRTILPPVYDEIKYPERYAEFMYALPTKLQDKWALTATDGLGTPFTDYIYDDVYIIFESLYAVNIDGKWGVVRYDGKKMLDFIFTFKDFSVVSGVVDYAEIEYKNTYVGSVLRNEFMSIDLSDSWLSRIENKNVTKGVVKKLFKFHQKIAKFESGELMYDFDEYSYSENPKIKWMNFELLSESLRYHNREVENNYDIQGDGGGFCGNEYDSGLFLTSENLSNEDEIRSIHRKGFDFEVYKNACLIRLKVSDLKVIKPLKKINRFSKSISTQESSYYVSKFSSSEPFQRKAFYNVFIQNYDIKEIDVFYQLRCYSNPIELYECALLLNNGLRIDFTGEVENELSAEDVRGGLAVKYSFTINSEKNIATLKRPEMPDNLDF